ncbi:hypothetical protein BCD_1761 (plasmid) [Borrelia crocidurae DOU]|uniref:Uncharacterized protein n=1 Tax=Borrelia crocidurae DOU TaxID=1293575 RepID=W5SLP9_9SPIR|nr:hypothetical protein BCD_1761 [Borrelia crocidurae DOU]
MFILFIFCLSIFSLFCCCTNFEKQKENRRDKVREERDEKVISGDGM